MSADDAQLLLISHYSLLIDLRLLGMTRVYKVKVKSVVSATQGLIAPTLLNKPHARSAPYFSLFTLIKGLYTTYFYKLYSVLTRVCENIYKFVEPLLK